MHELQWGRNFIVAEIAIPARHGDGLVRASMGPQLYRCGNLEHRRRQHPEPINASMGPQLYRCGNLCTLNHVTNRHGLLQWGRNFIVAEMCFLFVSHVISIRCFNGAATLSLRKFNAVYLLSLALGLCFNGAATLSLRKLER